MGFLKNVVTAFKPSNLAQGIEAARNPPSAAQIEASLASLTPEQRAAYDANMAEVERGRAESQAAWEQAKEISDGVRVLDGPAGRYLYGATPGDLASPTEIEAMMQADGTFATLRALRAERRGEFKQGLRQSFGIHEVKQLSDPQERAQVAAAERAARDAARASYRAPGAEQIAISRLATRGETQLAELLAHLHESGLAARPDQVFGVYRVPDRISGPVTPHSERGRVVEWDVVHTAQAAPPAGTVLASALVATSFRAAEQWVARRLGEPSLLDEELPLAFCLQAGIGPERCLGLARISEFRRLRGGDEDDAMRTLVQGVVAIHPQESSGTFERMRAMAPVELAPEAAAGVHVEVLNWEAIGQAVHLKVHEPPSVPSPFPYLPSRPQELLRAYLEIVGVHAFDCYSAQATVDRASPLMQGGFMSTNVGPKQPCADGKERMRTHGCQQVVIVYRDRPEYASGRERWEAYATEVLQARLHNGLGLRRPLAVPRDALDGVPKLLRPLARVAEVVDSLDDWQWGGEQLPPYRYCWPPADLPSGG